MFLINTIVYEHEKGLRFRNGLFVGLVQPGRRLSFLSSEKIIRFDVRERQSAIGGQETLTKDGATLRLSVVMTSKIVDAYQFYKTNPVMVGRGIANGAEADYMLHLQVQVFLREWIGSRTMELAMNQKLDMCGEILPDLQKLAIERGIEVTNLQLLDFGIAGTLKSAQADILKAELEGKAAMQRARNEASTLRSLINSAKLTQDHPGLLELRILSSGQKPRVTFVVGQPEPKVSEPTA